MLRQASHNFAWQTLTAVAAILLTPYLYAQLGSEAFALYSLVLSAFFLINYLNFGVPQYLLRELARPVGSGDRQRILSNAVVLQFSIGLVLSILCFWAIKAFGGRFIAADDHWLLWVVVLNVPLAMILVIARVWYEAQSRFEISAPLRASIYLPLLVVPCVVLWFGWRLTLVGSAISILMGTAIAGFSITNRAFLRPSSLSRAELALQIRRGGPFFAIAITAAAIGYSDRAALTVYVPLATLGPYFFLLDMVGRQTMASSAIGSIIYVRCCSLVAQKDFARVSELISSFLKRMFSLSALGLALALCAGPEIAVFLEVEQKELIVYGAVVWLGVLAQIGYAAYGYAIMAVGRESVLAKFQVSEAVVVTLLNWAAAVTFGVSGVALVFLSRSAVQMIFAHHVLYRELRFSPSTYGLMGLAGALSFLGGTVGWYLPSSLRIVAFGLLAFLLSREALRLITWLRESSIA